MNHWQEYRLGDFVDITHGFPFKSSFFSDTPTNIILLTPQNFKPGGGFDDSKFKYYQSTQYSISPQYILNPGDIILALTDLSRNMNILGYAGRVPVTYCRNGQKILHNQRIGRVIPLPGKMEKINRDFLYWLLRSVSYHEHIIATASGSTVKHTSPGRIKEFRFLLPPLKVQSKAAALLNAIENRLYLLHRSDTILEQAIMKCFREFFPDFSKYKYKPLSEFGQVICGKTPSKYSPHNFGGPVPFIKISDLRRQVYITHTEDTLSYEGASSQSLKQIPPNSICVSCVGTVGQIAFTTAFCHTNQQINSIIPHHHWQRYYLYCHLKNMKPQLKALSSGGVTISNLKTSRFAMLAIPQPPQSVLEKFYQVIHPFFQRILLNARHIDHLITFRDSLLQESPNVPRFRALKF